MTEFNLSEKRLCNRYCLKFAELPFYPGKDVKEFIKRLKEDYLKLGTRVFNGKSDQDVLDLIDKRAGSELI